MQAWAENFYAVLSRGDNLAIACMLVLVAFFVGWSLKEARRADRLTRSLSESEKSEALRSDLER